MTTPRSPREIRARLARALLLLFVASTPAAHAAEKDLATTLCGILKDLTPKVRTYSPEMAQGQLVMATAGEFDFDPEKLRRVQDEIDQVTTASCPKDREAMLAIVKKKSLAEAVR